ncbi:MAG: hypothetical protein QOE00_724 [Ilumatobacteraceae bacterium]|jgi:hypothetical protein
MFKKFVGALALIAALVVAGVVGFQLLHSPFTTVTKDHSPPPVLAELRDLSDFHAAQAQFEVTLDLEKDVKWVPSAIAGERVQFIGIGTVDAVIDFSKIGAGAVKISPDAKTVTLTLPSAYAAEPVLDHSQSHVMNRDRGLLNRVAGIFTDNPTSESTLYTAAANKMADAAGHTDLIGRAQTHTSKMLTALLQGMGFDQVNILYQPAATPV